MKQHIHVGTWQKIVPGLRCLQRRLCGSNCCANSKRATYKGRPGGGKQLPEEGGGEREGKQQSVGVRRGRGWEGGGKSKQHPGQEQGHLLSDEIIPKVNPEISAYPCQAYIHTMHSHQTLGDPSPCQVAHDV